MKNILNCSLLMIAATILSGCSVLNDANTQHLGNPITGGWVNYSNTAIGSNKYIVKAFAGQGVTQAELSGDFKRYANQLCHSRVSQSNFNIKTSLYEGSTIRPGLTLPTEGLELIGNVTCK